MKIQTIALFAFGAVAGSYAQISFAGGTYSQNFDSLDSTGTNIVWTDNSTLAGWYQRRVNDPTTELADQYNAGTGSSNTGAVYSFGSENSSERALGSIGSGTVEHAAYGVRLTNTSGQLINSVDISYTGEQWRDGGNASAVAHTLFFSYNVGGTTIGADTQATGGASGYGADPSFTTVSALDFTSPTAISTSTGYALDGNLASNRAAISGTISLNWAAGQDLWIRWVDINNVGNDHGLAVDDFSLTANPVPEPGTMAALVLGAAAFARRRRSK